MDLKDGVPAEATKHLLLQAIFDNAIEGMFIVDDRYVYMDANPAGCKLFGRSREEIIGKQVGSFSPPNNLSPDLLRRVRQNGEYLGNHQILLPDGTPLDVEISIKLGILPGLHLGMVRDITDKKRLERQFLQSQKMEALGRLAGGVAHDVNNMLMAIRGYGELLRNKLHAGEPNVRYADHILAAVDRAALVTKQLLAFSRQQVVQPEKLNLNTVVIEMDNLLRRSLGEEIRLELTLEPQLGQINADPGEIGQVLLNLAINARDAMPNGGHLYITTANVMLDDRYLRTHLQANPGPYVMLNVTDTGCGMDSQTCAKIFEPFFTTKPPGKGTGLGLPTTYGIVKQAGGFIYVYSEPGEGTSFKIYFPRAGAVASADHVTNHESASRTVLIVDDDKEINDAIAEHLRTQGYRVFQATTGRQATEICQANACGIDVVISDVTMPGTDGQDLCGLLEIHQPAAKVVFISGFSQTSLKHRGVLPPDAVFLQKPFSFEQLIQVLDRHFSPGRAEPLGVGELWTQ